MQPLIDPRHGDIEDDGSSTKAQSLLALAGSSFIEISWMKLIVAWLTLLVLPSLILGLAPAAAIAWADTLGRGLAAQVGWIAWFVVLAVIIAIGWYSGGALYRLAENSFWALNSIVIEPTYTVAREALRHIGDFVLPRDATQERRGALRAAMAALAGVIVSALAVAIAVYAWRRSFWAATIADFGSLRRLTPLAVANSVFLVASYLAVAALYWGFADASLPRPRDLRRFHPPSTGGRRWRIAHLTDLHIVGERYGFRIECGRGGPRGNVRLDALLSALAAAHERDPLDAVIISGDVTDAGRSAEWAEFADAIARYPQLADRAFLVPGNHDLNIADRGNPARMDLPTSPKRRLRQMRVLSAAHALQGRRVRVIDQQRHAIGPTLAEALAPHVDSISRFADAGRPRFSKWWLEVWGHAFPMIVPPDTDDGLGLILLDSNADTHFSFTNALGMVSREQVDGIQIAIRKYPRACWVIVLHHHVIEYPWKSHAFSERIGTALINGNWFIRKLLPLADRAIVMHGHRHVDWLGECAGLTIVSGPSPVMDEASCFYIHTIAHDADGKFGLQTPERIVVAVDEEKTAEP